MMICLELQAILTGLKIRVGQITLRGNLADIPIHEHYNGEGKPIIKLRTLLQARRSLKYAGHVPTSLTSSSLGGPMLLTVRLRHDALS